MDGGSHREVVGMLGEAGETPEKRDLDEAGQGRRAWTGSIRLRERRGAKLEGGNGVDERGDAPG